MFIKAQNGAVVEIDDEQLAARALKQGHEVFEGDPREKGAKPKAWKPAKADDDE